MNDLFIIIFCALAIISALFMILSRHPMRIALFLVTLMFNLAMIFGLSKAYVLAVGQVLIYVGAVMVFMIYVIMTLDKKDTSVQRPYTKYTFMMIPVFAIMSAIIVLKFTKGNNPQFSPTRDAITFEQFSKLFLSEYWLYFELTSVLLLVAAVCAVAVLKRHEKEE